MTWIFIERLRLNVRCIEFMSEHGNWHLQLILGYLTVVPWAVKFLLQSIFYDRVCLMIEIRVRVIHLFKCKLYSFLLYNLAGLHSESHQRKDYQTLFSFVFSVLAKALSCIFDCTSLEFWNAQVYGILFKDYFKANLLNDTSN